MSLVISYQIRMHVILGLGNHTLQSKDFERSVKCPTSSNLFPTASAMFQSPSYLRTHVASESFFETRTGI